MIHYESIKDCGELKGLNKTGSALLNENLAARNLYNQWDNDRVSNTKIK